MLRINCILALTTILVLDCGIPLLAQDDLKYKDIFSALQTAKKEDIYPLLKTYQGKDPYFANSYYQLGLINEDWAKSYDPLTEHEQVDYFIYNTKLYFGLAKHYLDEKQARRYKEYFNKVKPAAGKTEPGFKEIQDDLSEHLKNIELYEFHVTQTYNSFKKSVTFYNRCIGAFMNICGNHKMLKEIYLTANDSILKQTSLLQQDFDSTLQYFDKFRLALDSFPLKNYHQVKLLKSIETYRLDGLTGSDFTRDTVPIWNYREWVFNLDKILNTEIKAIRAGIDSTNSALDHAIASYLNKPEPHNPKYHLPEIDPILHNRLVRIDFGSAALKCITYKEKFLRFIVYARDSLNSGYDSVIQIPIARKSTYYRELIEEKQIVDSLLKSFGLSATGSNIRKYEKFFASNFPGDKGIEDYLSSQKAYITATLDKSLEFFNDFLQHFSQNQVATTNLLWKKLPVITAPLHPGHSDPLNSDHYQSYVSKSDKNGNLYLAGSLIQSGKKPMAFVAFAEKAKSINWLKTYDLSENSQEFYNYALNLELNSNGCFVAVSALFPGLDSVSVLNTIIRLDAKGNEFQRQKSLQGSVLRWLLFDDINNKLFAAFQGKKIGLNDPGPTELTFCALDSAGVPVWKYSEKLEGQLSEIVNMDNNWLIFCSVSAYASDSKWITVNDDKNQPSRGILAIMVDPAGNQSRLKLYGQCVPAVLEKLVKLDSETLNILGSRLGHNNNPGSSHNNPGKLVYILADKKGNSFYTYY